MQTKEQIKKTIKVVVICVALFILVLLIYHFFINKWYVKRIKDPVPDDIDYEFSEVNKNYQNPSYCSGGYFIVEENEKDNLSTLLLTPELNLIEKFDTVRENVYCLYDGYYLINNNGNYTLKRQGSIVKGNLSFPEDVALEDEILKDPSDSEAEYVSYQYLANVVHSQKLYEIDKYIYVANGENGYLMNKDTGKILDDKVKKLVPVVLDNEKGNYLYVESDSTYLFDITSENRLLENKKLIFTSINDNEAVNTSKNNILYQDENGIGILDFNENVIISPETQEIKLTSNNDKYFAVKRGNKYGLLNSFNNATFDFQYDNIFVMDDFVFLVQNKVLQIYNANINKLEKEFNLVSNDITVTKYDGFYHIKSVIDDGTKELIIENDGTINLVTGLRYIENSEMFYEKPCYFVYNKNKYSVYIDKDKQYFTDSKYTKNMDKAMFINKNLIFISYQDGNRVFYATHYVLSGAQVTSFVRDKVQEQYTFMKNKKLVFSQEDKKISVYYNDILKDELEAESITLLYDDYYALKTDTKTQFIKITQE